jgi:mono/diheme cytochrome c family protein
MNFFLFLLFFLKVNSLESGEILFLQTCSVCHPRGKNLILPEKNLQKESLKANGMNSLNPLIYQIRNGKNGMPGFEDRFTELEIKEVANYLLLHSFEKFEN